MPKVPEPFQEAFNQLYEAICYGAADMDVALALTDLVNQGCWGHLNKLLEIAQL